MQKIYHIKHVTKDENTNTILHKEFTLETLCRENQQTKELYCSYYIAQPFIVITILIANNSQHPPQLVIYHIIYIYRCKNNSDPMGRISCHGLDHVNTTFN